MIYGSTSHPVLVKKISLNVWRLRDEIVALVEKEVEEGASDLSSIATTYKTDYKSDDEKPDGPSSDAAEKQDTDSENAPADSSEASAEAKEAESTESTPDNTEENSTDKADDGEVKAEDEQASEQKDQTSDENTDSEKKSAGQIDQDNIFKARTILSEIYMDKMFFFSSEKFIVGQSVVIKFNIPKPFIMNAEVTYCREFNMKSRIISEKKMPYRAAVEFTFVKNGERENLRKFLKSVEPDLEAAKKAKESAPPQASEDNFDDLDDLDI